MATDARPAEDNPSNSGRSPEPTVVAATGEIDLVTAPSLHDTILAAAHRDRSSAVIVDFANVDFVGCSAVNCLVAARNHLRPLGVDVMVRSPTRPLAIMLNHFGLTELIEPAAPTKP